MLDLLTPIANRTAETTRRNRLAKIIVCSLVLADLLRVVRPGVALDGHDVRAPARDPWVLRPPSNGVAEAGVEGAEVVGRVDDRLAGEVERDARLAQEVLDDPTV